MPNLFVATAHDFTQQEHGDWSLDRAGGAARRGHLVCRLGRQAQESTGGSLGTRDAPRSPTVQCIASRRAEDRNGSREPGTTYEYVGHDDASATATVAARASGVPDVVDATRWSPGAGGAPAAAPFFTSRPAWVGFGASSLYLRDRVFRSVVGKAQAQALHVYVLKRQNQYKKKTSKPGPDAEHVRIGCSSQSRVPGHCRSE